MSHRDKVLDAASDVVAVWRKTFDAVPDALDDAVIALKHALEANAAQLRARNSDPATSHQGPSKLKMTVGRNHVLRVFQDAQRPLTDAEAVSQLHGIMSASGVRSRRSELVRMGRLADSGERTRHVTIKGQRIKLPRLQTLWKIA